MHTPPVVDYGQLMRQIAAPQDGIVFKNTGNEAAETVPETALHFFPMQIPEEGDGVIALSDAEPVMEGSDEKPDMLMKLEMLGFNIGNGEDIRNADRAIMQLTIGQENTAKNRLNPLYWVVSAGLELYSSAKGQKNSFSELAVKVDEAFNKEYIEVPGGLANLTFKVVKEKKPKWWNEVFDFVKSPTGTALTAAFGLPGVPQVAVNTITTLLDKLKSRQKDVLFSSKFGVRLALSDKAFNEVAGTKKEDIGVLNPGLFILIRGQDYKYFRDNPGKYNHSHDAYFPEAFSTEQIFSEKNPFDNYTFAIFKVGMQEVNLSKKFDFGSDKEMAV